MDESLEVLGDPGRIRQVLSNLMTNALNLTTEGSVSISVSSKPLHPQLAGDDHVEVQFVIEDTGIGIKKHVLEKLFRPFRQGDSSTVRLYGGTGLGLTISKNVSLSLIFFSGFQTYNGSLQHLCVARLLSNPPLGR